MKNRTKKDLFDLMQIQIAKSDNVESKTDKHIDEFKSFKSDTNIKFDILFSLPTITKEFKNSK